MYHWRRTRNSPPGSSSRFTTSSCNTFSQWTSSRDPARRAFQNSCKPSRSHNSHASQQLPNKRGRRSSRPLSSTCRPSTASAGISRSSGNKLKFACSRCCSSNTDRVLSQVIVDLAKIENGSLHRLVRSDAMVFYDAEVNDDPPEVRWQREVFIQRLFRNAAMETRGLTSKFTTKRQNDYATGQVRPAHLG